MRSALCLILVSIFAASTTNAVAAENDPGILIQTIQISVLKYYRSEKKHDDALSLLNQMIGSPKAGSKTFTKENRGWAYANLEVRKERARVYEEIATADPKIFNWGRAVQEWVAISKMFAPFLAEERKAIYFDLYFEQKRCSVLAYTTIGVDATKGNQESYDEKFATFAKAFYDLLCKNPNLVLVLGIDNLIKNNNLLATEFAKLVD